MISPQVEIYHRPTVALALTIVNTVSYLLQCQWHDGEMLLPSSKRKKRDKTVYVVSGSEFESKDFIESAIEITQSLLLHLELNNAEAARILDDSVNAVATNFNGVEIHGANRYLINQFLQESGTLCRTFQSKLETPSVSSASQASECPDVKEILCVSWASYMIHLLQIYIEKDSLPQLRSGPTGKIFTGGKPPGKGGCTTQQYLSLWY
ncbi:hypothetical protein F4604DRAFT_1686191 [Suillus subluteus]|nr:hypothetical protein F4604DRAFT_1686191 [Suillus subluteus]